MVNAGDIVNRVKGGNQFRNLLMIVLPWETAQQMYVNINIVRPKPRRELLPVIYFFFKAALGKRLILTLRTFNRRIF